MKTASHVANHIFNNTLAAYKIFVKKVRQNLVWFDIWFGLGKAVTVHTSAPQAPPAPPSAGPSPGGSSPGGRGSERGCGDDEDFCEGSGGSQGARHRECRGLASSPS